MISILLGCGGSGLKTLQRLNQMMSEDLNWRHEVSRSIYYLAVDTDADALVRFNRCIQEQMRGAELPFIGTLQLSKGIHILNEVVHQYMERPFENNLDSEGRRRIMEQWWFRDDEPFRAPWVKDLTLGAGQCPAASTLLAWWRMPEFEALLQNMAKAMKHNRKADGAPLGDETVNLIIVTGLAGGTGRGCWTLLSFKIRQFLSDQERLEVSPVAVLFDATVFDNVAAQYREQETFLKINSLTGISELSCWMANRRAAATSTKDAYVYRLPNLHTPSRQGTDVLNTSLRVNVGQNAPVDNAYLIFNESPVAVLGGNDQYHEMAGTGLYALLTTSDIQSQRVNENASYMSMAGAAFEVDVSRLRKYFENKARARAANRLAGLVTDVSGDISGFFKKCPIRMTVTDVDRSGFTDNAKGNLLERACDALLTGYQNDLMQLEKALSDDDPQQVIEIVDNIVTENPEAARAAVMAAAASLKLAADPDSSGKRAAKSAAEAPNDPKRVGADMAIEVYRSARSIESVNRFVCGVLAQLEESFAEMPAKMDMDDQTDPRKLAVAMQKKDWPLGRRYNPGECEELKQKTRAGILMINYPSLRDELRNLCQPWMDFLSRQRTALDLMDDALTRIGVKFENESSGAADCKPGEDPHPLLFADPACPENAVPKEKDPTRFFRRVLRPAMTRADVGKLVDDCFQTRPGLEDFLRKSIESCSDDSGQGLLVQLNSAHGRDRFRKDLEVVVRENVYLPDEFMLTNFGFLKVVESIRAAWEKRIESVRGDADRKARLVRQLEIFMGVKLVKDSLEEKELFPEPMEILKQMAASLASLCKPWWKTETKGTTTLQTVVVFLPAKVVSVEAVQTEIEAMISSTKLSVFDEGKAGRAINPYAIVAFASQAVSRSSEEPDIHELDKVLSLRYYKNASVDKWLRLCETEDGESIFRPDDNNKGIGYISPVFLKNEKLRELRWKPWAAPSAETTELDEEALQALLYAFLPMPKDASAAAALAGMGWTMPLIRDAGQEKYVFARRALELGPGNQAEEDLTCPWEKDESLCVSIWQVRQLLAGKGKRGVDGTKGDAARKQGAEWRRRILQEAKVFWENVAKLAGCTRESNAGRAMLRLRDTSFADLRKKAAPDDQAVWDALIKAGRQKATVER